VSDVLARPDVVALAEQLHLADCAAMYRVQPTWQPEHHDRDRAKALRVIAGLRASGHRITPVEEQP
jgi:hypothetical protein